MRAFEEGYSQTGRCKHIARMRGPKGAPFTYEDFTEEQLAALVGPKGDKGDTGDTGERGDAFTYEDFTEEQLAALVGPKGDKGDTGDTGAKGDTGARGASGRDGRTWHSGTDLTGTGDVAFTLDVEVQEGDHYLNTETGAIYQCIDAGLPGDAEAPQLWRFTMCLGNGTAQGIAISDVGGYFTGDHVESALQELGAALEGVDELIGTGVIE